MQGLRLYFVSWGMYGFVFLYVFLLHIFGGTYQKYSCYLDLFVIVVC